MACPIAPLLTRTIFIDETREVSCHGVVVIARRLLAVAHIAIGILLMPMIVISLLVAAPILLIGPIWGIVLGLRLWRSDPRVDTALRRTHLVYLAIDGLLIAYGFWMLRAAEESAARGGGLLGGIGLIPIGLGILLAMFSVVTLFVVRARRAVE